MHLIFSNAHTFQNITRLSQVAGGGDFLSESEYKDKLELKSPNTDPHTLAQAKTQEENDLPNEFMAEVDRMFVNKPVNKAVNDVDTTVQVINQGKHGVE